MTHPLTPREKVARIVDPLAFSEKYVRWTDPSWAEKKSKRLSAAVAKADAVLAALASGSGDHAELLEKLRKVEGGQDDGFDPAAARTMWHRNPDGPEAADALEALLAEVAALRADRRNLASHATMGGTDGDGLSVNEISVRITAIRNEMHDRATEAERKLAEAVGLLKPFSEAAESLDDETRDHDHIWEQPAAMNIDAGDLRAARTFLSKEAERG